MKNIYYTLALLTAFFAIGCNETLEETYDEYTEGGMIRYLGKCSNLEVNPGWERLQIVWKNVLICSSLFWTILNMSVTAGITILVILAVRAVFRRAPRKYLYVLWLAAARSASPARMARGTS